MPRRLLPVVLFTAFAASSAVVACTSRPPTDDVQAMCDRYEKALLGFSARCGGDVSAETIAHDLVRHRVECKIALAAPGTGFTTAWMSACAIRLDAATCDTSSAPPVCEQATGTLADGAACGGDDQCSSQSFCLRAIVQGQSDAGFFQSTAPCGSCVPRSADGTPCFSPTQTECLRGSECNPSSGLCQKIVRVGLDAPCNFGGPTCDVGLFCDFSTFSPPTCKKLPGPFDPCTSGQPCPRAFVCRQGICDPLGQLGDACDSNSCGPGLWCDDATAMCSTPARVPPGEACDGARVSCALGFCDRGTCTTFLADGASCDPASFSSVCDTFAACIDGICRIPDATACR